MKSYPRYQYAHIDGQIVDRVIRSAEEEDPEVWKETPADLPAPEPKAPKAPHNGMSCAEIDAKFEAAWNKLSAEHKKLQIANEELTSANKELTDELAQVRAGIKVAAEESTSEAAAEEAAKEAAPAEEPAEKPAKKTKKG